jgi:hypothetical protein
MFKLPAANDDTLFQEPPTSMMAAGGLGRPRVQQSDARDGALTPVLGQGDLWLRLKDEGTALLKAGDPTGAAAKYVEASLVASSRADHIKCSSFLNGLHGRSASPLRILAGKHQVLHTIASLAFPADPLFFARNRDSKVGAINRVRADGVSCSELWWAVTDPLQMLLRGQTRQLLPNMNVAVCSANAAAAYLEAGDIGQSLQAGLCAIVACPEYAKAYHRVIRSLLATADGDPATSRHQVDSVLNTATTVELLGQQLPSVALTLFAAGLIEYEQLLARQAWCLQRILERDRPFEVQLTFSLVPMDRYRVSIDERGQWLVMSIGYWMPDDSEERSHNAVRVEIVDASGGNELERPPNGHATGTALAACIRLIPEWITDIQSGRNMFALEYSERPMEKLNLEGLSSPFASLLVEALQPDDSIDTSRIILGQGLTEHAQLAVIQPRPEGGETVWARPD